MRCHYIYDEGQKVLIPGCMGGCYIDKVEDCLCRPESWAQFERKEFNDQVKAMKAEIEQLEGVIENYKQELKRRKNEY